MDRSDVFTALWTVALNIGLPSFDVYSDIYLGIRLYMNGHPKWALSVLMPMFLNMFFTIFACIRIEGKKFVFYLPLVFLQIYPQFLVVRILLKWAKGKFDRDDFLIERDSLDGGIGCFEPYLESVPQAFIQTAFFVVANSLSATTERLCYNEINSPCHQFDNCSSLYKCSNIGYDSNNCKPIGFQPLQYKNRSEILDC